MAIIIPDSTLVTKGLTENTVDKINKAFHLSHTIFKSLAGWPTCTVYRLVTAEGARSGEGNVLGIEFLAQVIECEYDQKYDNRVAVAGVERMARDISFTFYDFKIPDNDYRIVFGHYTGTANRDSNGKNAWGPYCPKCLGYGVRNNINQNIIGTTWINPNGSNVQCGYCYGLCYDIMSDEVSFFMPKAIEPDSRFLESVYPCYALNNEVELLRTVLNKKPEVEESGEAWTTTPDYIDQRAQGNLYRDPEVAQIDEDNMATWDADYWLDWWLQDPENRHMPAWITGNEEDGAGGYGPPA
jgi:hypothetical protein